jgi:hypothetical protein
MGLSNAGGSRELGKELERAIDDRDKICAEPQLALTLFSAPVPPYAYVFFRLNTTQVTRGSAVALLRPPLGESVH